VFQKSDDKIETTITKTNLIRIIYPLSSFNYCLSGANIANFNKIHYTVSEQQLFKNGTQKRKFLIWKSRLSSSYTITSVAVCAQSSRHLHGHMRVVEHTTVELLGQWCCGRSNATPRWDAVWGGRRRESCYSRCIDGAFPTPHSPRDLGQGYWAAIASVRWNMVYCRTKTPRCHQLGELEHCLVQ